MGNIRLKKPWSILSYFSEDPRKVAPSCFHDHVALKTDWTPARTGGTNFRTRILKQVNSNRAEFQASIGAILFYLFFFIAGMVMLLIVLVNAILSSREFSWDIGMIVPLSVGLVFTIVGGCLFHFGTIPIVFDKTTGHFWKGRKRIDQMYGRAGFTHVATLEEIYAIQLISEHCGDSDGSYDSYELNLVLKNGKRINVIDHGDQKNLREDANTLAAFLEKPVWDAISC
jgi:hypothetical protein